MRETIPTYMPDVYSDDIHGWYKTDEAVKEMNEELDSLDEAAKTALLTDNVTRPKHYLLFNGEVEVIDLIRDRCEQIYEHTPGFDNPATIGYMYGNAIKYLMRWPLKNGVEDLRKCRQYLDMMIEELS